MGLRATFVLLITAAATAAAPAPQERYAVMTSGDRVGHLQVTRSGTRVEIDFRIDDNGRGPKIRETWQLGADGLPRQLTLSGTTTYGSPAKESFRSRDGKAEWRSLNDRGSAPASGQAAYLPIDGSPYYVALYLPALLAAPERTLPAWPAGSLRAERVRDVPLGRSGRSATVWAIWGIDLYPRFVMADSAGRWIGAINSGYVMVPEELAGESQALSRLAVSLEAELLGRLTKRLAHRWEQPVRVRNVRVLDPTTGTLSDPTTVVTSGGRITAIAPDLERTDSGVVIEGEGGTLVPGLFDLHVHYGTMDGPLQLAAGVTTVRDMGNIDPLLDATVRGIESGTLMGPSVVRSGFIEGQSKFASRGGFIADSLPAALDAVRRYAAHGYWQVKLYNSMPPDWVAPIAAEAHRLGLKVAGHVPAFSSSPRVVRDGYDEITHINQLILSFLIDTDKEDTRTPFRFTALGLRTAKLSLDDARLQALVAEMKQRGVAHDPTIATFQSLLLARPGGVTTVDCAVARPRARAGAARPQGGAARRQAGGGYGLSRLVAAAARGAQAALRPRHPPGARDRRHPGRDVPERAGGVAAGRDPAGATCSASRRSGRRSISGWRTKSARSSGGSGRTWCWCRGIRPATWACCGRRGW